MKLAHAANIRDAIAYADRLAMPLDRLVTVHLEKAGVMDPLPFIRAFLGAARRDARRAGGDMAAVWVREDGPDKGAHVHMLMHLPVGMTLRNRTAQWVVKAGGRMAAHAIDTRPVGGHLGLAYSADPITRALYDENADRALSYILKAADDDTAATLGLGLSGQHCRIIGKRQGVTHNIGRTARDKAGWRPDR